MKKRSFIAMMGIVVMMAMVVVMSIGSKTSADACSWFKKKVQVNLYTGNSNADGFNVKVVKTKLTAKKIIKALQKEGAVANGVKVRAFIDNDTHLILNLSQAFADDVASAGTSGEYIKVGSVVNTFLDAFDADTILITVEGQSWESGHAIYDEPLSAFPIQTETPDEDVNEDVNEDTNEDTNDDTNQDENEEVNTATNVNVYVGNENADGFNVKTVEVAEVTPENLISALQAEGAVAAGVTVNSFRAIESNLILDLSGEFRDDVCSAGSAGEYIKVGSVVNTFLDAYNYSEILITVNGEPWESGHAIYDNTLTRFN